MKKSLVHLKFSVSTNQFDSRPQSWSRRQWIRNIAVASAAAAVGPGIVRLAHAAKDKEVVMSMSGGSYMENWQKKIIDPFQKETGITVKMVPGSFHAHAMRVRASRRGAPPFDLLMGDGFDFINLIAGGYLLPLAASKVPNLAEVAPKFRDQFDDRGVLFDYASLGIAYSTARVKNPPKSWREFVDRTAAGDFGNRVFCNNLPAGVRGPEFLMLFDRVFGKDDKDVDAGFAAFKRMKPHVFKFFTTFSDPVQLITNGEGDIGPGWDGRTYIAHDAGEKIDWIAPTEGVGAAGPTVGVVKGGNSDAAYALLNYSIGAVAQKAFCEAMGYGAVNAKVVYSERLAKRVPSVQNAIVADNRFISEHLREWVERWNREIL